ncbi:MobA/MobL family protein [Thioclava sp.]
MDHRSFKERGIDRIPEIHEGPAARAGAGELSR